MSPMEFVVHQMAASKHAVSSQDDREELAVEAMQGGMPARAASARYDVSYTRICALRAEHGMARPKRKAAVHVTRTMQAGIEAMLRAMATRSEITERYGVGISVIQRIKRESGIAGRPAGTNRRWEAGYDITEE